jgi:hypothetical protein
MTERVEPAALDPQSFEQGMQFAFAQHVDIPRYELETIIKPRSNPMNRSDKRPRATSDHTKSKMPFGPVVFCSHVVQALGQSTPSMRRLAD